MPKNDFYTKLAKTEPEEKRKIIGSLFIDVFQEESKRFPWCWNYWDKELIYPDVIESVSVHGPSVTIKSHHNVGGLRIIYTLNWGDRSVRCLKMK